VDQINFINAERMERSVWKNNATKRVRQFFGITKSTPQHLSFGFQLHLREEKKWINASLSCMYPRFSSVFVKL
jgi:hypothetical protein